VAGLANPHGISFAVGRHRGPLGESLYILPPYALFFLRSADGGATWERLNNTHGVQSTHDAQGSSNSFTTLCGVSGSSRVYLGGESFLCAVSPLACG
jgi:hypothetical protein